MKDFSLYGFSPNDKILSDAEYIYNMQLEGLEGKDVTIDGLTCKALIYNHLNELNELKEERVITCSINIPLKRGSLVGFENGFYMVTALPDNHMIYWKGKILKTNNFITSIDSNNNIFTLPCIKESATLYSDGQEEGKTMKTLDDELKVSVPYNEQTCKFKVGQRFIFDKKSIYIIKSFDESSYMENVNGNLQGVLKIHMSRTESRATDDLQSNLADNSDLIEMPILLEIPNRIIELKVGDTFKITPTLTKNGQVITDINELNKITYTTTNDTLVTISTDGIITALSNGGVDLFVNYGSQSIKIECYISPTNVAKYSIQLSGAETIKDGRYNIYSMKLYDDKGLEILPISTIWELVNVDGIASELVYIYSYDNTTCKIKCNSNLDNIGKKFKLKCTSNGVYVEELIQIVSAF